MAFAEGFERGGRMAQGIIGTYRDANQRARERAAEEEIAALNAQYARSGEMIEAPPPRTGLRPDLVSGALPVNINRMQPTPAAGLGPTPAPAQQPIQQMLRQVATPASGGLTARMNTEAAAVAERPVRTTPTPPAQSQIYRDQADVYSRYGLTDQARRTRDLGLGAARDEERMATEKERYETTQQQYQEGLRREDARNMLLDKRWWAQENRTIADEQKSEREFLQTSEALNAIASGISLEAAFKDNPFANFSQLFNVSEAMREVGDRDARKAAYDAFNARRETDEGKAESVIDTIRFASGGDPDIATPMLEYYAAENQAEIEEGSTKAAVLLNDLRFANTAEKFNAATKTVYGTDAPGDPEWVRASSLPQAALAASGIPPETVATMWLLKEGDLINTDAGVYFDTAGISGWEFARDAAIDTLSGRSPIEAAITMQNLQKAGTNVVTPEVAAKIFGDAFAGATDNLKRFDKDLFEELLEMGNAFATTGRVPSRTSGVDPDTRGQAAAAREFYRTGGRPPPDTQTGINTANGADTARQQIARAQSITAELEEADAAYTRLNARNPSGGNPQVNAEKAAIESRIQQLSRERQEIMIGLGLPPNTAF